VFQTDLNHDLDTRWLKTVSKGWLHVDGNPDLPENGGIQGLAENHCLGSIANHLKKANSEYQLDEDFVSDRLFWPNNPGFKCGYSCTLRALKDMKHHHQILCNYELVTKNLVIEFDNESLYTCLKEFCCFQLHLERR